MEGRPRGRNGGGLSGHTNRSDPVQGEDRKCQRLYELCDLPVPDFSPSRLVQYKPPRIDVSGVGAEPHVVLRFGETDSTRVR